MSGWTPDELVRIGKADELDLASQRRDGSLRDPVTMWVVRDGDDLYVRSMHGRAGAWFRGTQTRRRGHSVREASIRTSPLSSTRIRRSTTGSTPLTAISTGATGTASSAVSSIQRHESQPSSSYRASSSAARSSEDTRRPGQRSESA